MTSVTSRVRRGCCCVCVERRSDEDDIRLNCIALKEKKHFEMSIVHIQCDKGEHNAKLWNEE